VLFAHIKDIYWAFYHLRYFTFTLKLDQHTTALMYIECVLVHPIEFAIIDRVRSI